MKIVEFPYDGRVHRVSISQLGAEITDVIFEGLVDIQHTSIEMGLVAQSADYAIFTEMPKDDNGNYFNPIRRDDMFEGEFYGEKITGRVRNAQPSQLGKLTFYISREIWGE